MSWPPNFTHVCELDEEREIQEAIEQLERDLAASAFAVLGGMDKPSNVVARFRYEPGEVERILLKARTR